MVLWVLMATVVNMQVVLGALLEALLVHKGQQALLDHKVQLVLLALLVHKEQLVLPVLLARRDLQDLLDQLVQ